MPSEAPAALLRAWDSLQPWPEVPKVLSSLKAKGYRLAVITNCSKELGHKAAARCGVEFDVVLTAEEVGCVLCYLQKHCRILTNSIRFYKPRKEAYGAVVNALGLTTSEVLFVAGSSGDVVGAADAGMQVVWNNHINLAAKPGSNPLKEGRSLHEALADFL
jgi:2-haloacid dehalogenase